MEGPLTLSTRLKQPLEMYKLWLRIMKEQVQRGMTELDLIGYDSCDVYQELLPLICNVDLCYRISSELI